MERIYAKSADKNGNGNKEPLYEHTKKDIDAGRRLVGNLPFTEEEKQRIGRDLDEAIAFHDLGKSATGFQDSLEKDAPYWGYRHEIVSAAAATNVGASNAVIFVVLTHHKQILSRGLTPWLSTR